MSYIVSWTADAELASAWLGAADRTAVATASHILDLAMARDPWNCGFARAPYRIRTAVASSWNRI
jgi:hypothetical protein